MTAPHEPISAVACEICGNHAGNRQFSAREMMLGLRERFDYMECAGCGCLQLLDVPQDLSRFYPGDYYSLVGVPALDRSFLVKLKKLRARALLRLPAGLLDTLVHAWWLSPLFVPTEFMWFGGLRLRTSSPVSDLGSGNGKVLAWMWGQGFSRLTGFDPLIENDLSIGGVIAIHKLGVEDMPAGWDLVMLNHSFEHMPRPAQVLRSLRERLGEGGSIILRMPVATSWAWRTYGSDWVQLDAPRHLFIHTPRSVSILAEQAGMVLSRVFFDSGPFQFWGSEQYRRDIPLRDPRSHWADQSSGLFSDREIKAFHRRAQRLNREGAGDSAGFVLRAGERASCGDE
jgi:SAM-dependent methyltransferase